MPDSELTKEGDVNFTVHRQQWLKTIADCDDTMQWLEKDAAMFIHQSLSTPCLDVLESCEGIFITDISGRKFMDFHGNNVHQIGYCNPFVIEKVKQQMDKLPFSPRRYANKPAVQLAEKLSALLPAGLNKVLFAPGGTSAVGIALKLARFITGKHKIITLQDSFHGASMDAIAAGGEAQFKIGLGPLMPGVYHIPQPVSYRTVFTTQSDDLGYADILEKMIIENGEIGAVLIETIRNTDVQIPSKAFWKRVEKICHEHQVLLILDEIPIAFGRTGKMFAFEHFGIEPDILCLGKGLGAGIIPIAAIVARNEFDIAAAISLGHYTHEKSPLGAVAALAMLEFIERENLLDKVKEDEIFMREALNHLKEKYPLIGDIRGIGLLWGIELVKDRNTKEKASEAAEKVMYECLKQGLSFKVSQSNVLQLCPPLIITREQLKLAISILDKAIEKISCTQ